MRNFNADLNHETTDATRIQPAPSFSPPPPAATPAATPKPKPEARVAVLGPTLRFKGELSAEEDFILQGRIEGSINHTQSVTIGEQGSAVGNIHARKITIDGTVEGDLHALESVVVHETGRLTGNIYAPRVGIVEGAYFNGRVEMVRTEGTRQSKPGVPMSEEETEKMLGRE